MSLSIETLSKELNISVNDLQTKSIQAFLEREIRLTEEDIADIRERYNLTDRAKIEKAIKDGLIPSHPAWEDLITWENLENYISTLKEKLDLLGV